jgi:CBS domain-containing protein
MIKVRQAFTPSVIAITPEARIPAAVELMRREHVDALLVGGPDVFAGIVTEVDLVHRVLAEDRNPAATTVGEIMHGPVQEIDADESLAEAGDRMAQAHLRHLAVRDGGRIVGLLSVRELLATDSLPLAPARQIMSSPVHTIPAGTTARAAAVELKERRHGSLVVTRGGAPAGIVTESDLVHKVLGQGRPPAETAVEEIMSAPLVSVDVNQPVESLRELMVKRRIRHLGVMEQGRIVGVISARDLLHPTYYEVIGW